MLYKGGVVPPAEMQYGEPQHLTQAEYDRMHSGMDEFCEAISMRYRGPHCRMSDYAEFACLGRCRSSDFYVAAYYCRHDETNPACSVTAFRSARRQKLYIASFDDGTRRVPRGAFVVQVESKALVVEKMLELMKLFCAFSDEVYSTLTESVPAFWTQAPFFSIVFTELRSSDVWTVLYSGPVAGENCVRRGQKYLQVCIHRSGGVIEAKAVCFGVFADLSLPFDTCVAKYGVKTCSVSNVNELVGGMEALLHQPSFCQRILGCLMVN